MSVPFPFQNNDTGLCAEMTTLDRKRNYTEFLSTLLFSSNVIRKHTLITRERNLPFLVFCFTTLSWYKKTLCMYMYRGWQKDIEEQNPTWPHGLQCFLSICEVVLKTISLNIFKKYCDGILQICIVISHNYVSFL